MRLPLLALYVFCLIFVSRSLAQDDNKPPLAKILPVTQEIGAFAVTAMSNCPASSKTINIIAGINRNGTYTLVGDLFHNGETNALIDCHIPHGIDNYGDEVSVDNVIISKWSGQKWNSIGFIDFEPYWIKHYRGRDAENDKPFWMLYLRGHPIIVVAGGVEKEGQSFTCFLMDHSGKNILDSIDSFSQEPTVKGEHLITGDASRVKATTEITYYSTIKNNKFVTVIESGSYMPYRQPGELPSDPTNKEYSDLMDVDDNWIVNNKCTYIITGDYSTNKPLANYLIFAETDPVIIDSFQSDWESIVDNARTLVPYAKIYFDNSTDPNLWFPYISWKITRLPSAVFNSPDHPNIESLSKIKVMGSPEVVKLLSP